jgi:hypothetical protein
MNATEQKNMYLYIQNTNIYSTKESTEQSQRKAQKHSECEH